ncbi:carbohydrate-binding family 9-like protein [Flavisolibacter nicotianae]|uniref:carbohydrate-binding family 9-like protein n=1 Tax=Flavisolibacter nicotianae TaxID=2364882 RepID=UPI000EB433CA|nr:carbohydrate-binding family 9-like protein [Flavisolibacter nicotianae]
MKQLRAIRLPEPAQPMAIKDIAARLTETEKHSLSFAPWPAFPYRPDVQFSIAYREGSICLQYTVSEKDLQAAYGKINEPVYQDSCVEFFISFDEGATYYNFEFNCIGTVLAGYGKGRGDRQVLPESVLRKIDFLVSIQKGGEGIVRWELTVDLPLECFVFQPLRSLQGQQCRANFYKCGDALPQPHFLTWSMVQSESPDFHRPEFFGSLWFD